MADAVVIGADLGSRAARVVAVTPDGAVAGDAAASYRRTASWAPGRADPESWLDALGAAVAQLQRAMPRARKPAAFAVGGQSPTVVPVGGGLAVTCRHPAGGTLPPAEQHAAQQEVLRRELGDGVAVLQLWDWVLQRLGAPAACGRWPGDPDLPGFGRRIPTGAAVGKADGTIGLPPGTPLVPGAQDAYLSFWAGGLDTLGRALDPGGRTGGIGIAVAASERPRGMYGLPGPVPGVDIVGGPTSSHGLVLEWWSAMTGQPVGALLELAATVPPGANGVVALPYLEGERAPRWNRDLRAELVGLGADTGPGEVTRALLEATAYGLAHIVGDLAGSGVRFDVLVVGGAPARSRLWATIKASVLEVPVEVPEYPELTAYGAALAAGAAVGWWPAPGEGAPGGWPRPPGTRLDPEPQPAYRDGFRRFLALGDEAARRSSAAHDHQETNQ